MLVLEMWVKLKPGAETSKRLLSTRQHKNGVWTQAASFCGLYVGTGSVLEQVSHASEV